MRALPICEARLWLRFVLLLALFLCAIAFTPFPARAAEADHRLELLAGTCYLHDSGQGVWQNRFYPGSPIDLSPSCAQISWLHIYRREPGVAYGIRLGYVDLGRIDWMATYPLRDDEQFTVRPDGKNCSATHPWHSSSDRRGCVAQGQHSEWKYGVSLGYVVERDWGPVTLGADIGGFLYMGRFTYRIVSWPDPTKFSGEDSTSVHGYRLTPYLGLTARYKNLMAQFRTYGSVKAHRNGCGDCTGLTTGPAAQLNVGLAMPF